MHNEIAIICNSLNPLIKRVNGLEGYWVDILNGLHSLNNNNTNVSSRLALNGFSLTSRELLQLIDINKESQSELEAFTLFLHYKINKDDHELPIVGELIELILNNQKQYKKIVREFIEDKEQNIYLHNFAVCNERIILFLNKLFTLFSLNLYKPNKNKRNSEIFKDFQNFLAEYEMEKEKFEIK